MYLPFNKKQAEDLIGRFGSPLYVYDERGIIESAQELNKNFVWIDGYKNYFAVKATPTPMILKLLHKQGMGFDCSSRAELEMVNRLGIEGRDIFFTSNNTTKEDFDLAIELGAIVNIDDITQIPVFLEVLGDKAYDRVAMRFNPGNKHTGNVIIGEPSEAKYGIRWDQLKYAYQLLSQAKIKELGIHTMVASNERNPEYFGITASLVKQAIDQIETETDAKIAFINLGGGFGVNYSPEEKPLDLAMVSKKIKDQLGDFKGNIFTENGRLVLASNGYLLTKVRYVMDKYKHYVGVDASMHNLMRPGMYNAYHHISNLSDRKDQGVFDVVGSLCENNDKFAINRKLPTPKPEDILVVHTVGAHGHSMGFNYNGLLRSAEVLLKADGSSKLIRRAQKIDDYFSTLVWR